VILVVSRQCWTGIANSFQSRGAIFVGFSKFFSRGVRLCTHEKVPKIFLARGAILYTRKNAPNFPRAGWDPRAECDCFFIFKTEFTIQTAIIIWKIEELKKKIKFKLKREDCIMPLEVCNKPMNFLVNSQVFEQNGYSLLKNIFGSRNSFFLRGGSFFLGGGVFFSKPSGGNPP